MIFEDRGEHRLKNIARPARVYRVQGVGAAASPLPTLPLPQKPSIAVLPFQNMSGDPAQDYFSDGIAEDIITELSRFRSLFVVARNSSFSLRGKTDVNEVSRRLGVRYVVEGSVRKADKRVRARSNSLMRQVAITCGASATTASLRTSSSSRMRSPEPLSRPCRAGWRTQTATSPSASRLRISPHTILSCLVTNGGAFDAERPCRGAGSFPQRRRP